MSHEHRTNLRFKELSLFGAHDIISRNWRSDRESMKSRNPDGQRAAKRRQHAPDPLRAGAGNAKSARVVRFLRGAFTGRSGIRERLNNASHSFMSLQQEGFEKEGAGGRRLSLTVSVSELRTVLFQESWFSQVLRLRALPNRATMWSICPLGQGFVLQVLRVAYS